MQAIIDACKQGHLDATVCVVISNNSEAVAIERQLGFTHSHNDAEDVLDSVGGSVTGPT